MRQIRNLSVGKDSDSVSIWEDTKRAVRFRRVVEAQSKCDDGIKRPCRCVRIEDTRLGRPRTPLVGVDLAQQR